MPNETKDWVRQRIYPIDLEGLPFRIWLALISQQQQRLDVCNGFDPDRPSPYGE